MPDRKVIFNNHFGAIWRRLILMP